MRRKSESENDRYRRLVEQSSNLIWEMDSRMRITYVNSRVFDTFGYTSEEVTGTHFRNYISHDDFRRTVEFFMGKRKQQHVVRNFIGKARHRDGHCFFLQVDAVQILDSDGNFNGFQCLARDVTSEIQINNQQELFRNVVEQSEEAIFILSNEEIINCNTAAVKLFEADNREQFYQLNPGELSPHTQPDGSISLEKAQEMIHIAMDKNFHRFEWMHRSFKGRTFPAEIILTRIFYERSVVLHATIQDLTEVKQKEQTLANFQKGLEQSLNGIAMADLKGNISYVNRSWANMHGYKTSELNNCRISTFHTRQQMETEVNKLNEQVKIHGAYSGEVNHKRKDGTTFPTFMTISSLKDEAGQPVGLMEVALDISETKAMESLARDKEAAEIANRAKSVFLANISHELRTPMHGILSYAAFGISKFDKVPPHRIKGYFIEIRNSAQHLMLLLNDLLDLSKLESGRMQYTFTENDILYVMDMAINRASSLAEEKNIRLHLPSFTHSFSTSFDPNRILQVLSNLLRNAIKYSKEDSEVYVNCRRIEENRKSYLLISVRDSGIGVPDDELTMIFDKFIQSSSTQGEGGGTGLGLPICRKIISDHGGRIWAKHAEPAGIEVFFTLPCSE